MEDLSGLLLVILVVAKLIIIRALLDGNAPIAETDLTYQIILLTWRRVLLANCPHEAECVNIQVAM